MGKVHLKRTEKLPNDKGVWIWHVFESASWCGSFRSGMNLSEDVRLVTCKKCLAKHPKLKPEYHLRAES